MRITATKISITAPTIRQAVSLRLDVLKSIAFAIITDDGPKNPEATANPFLHFLKRRIRYGDIIANLHNFCE